MSVAYLDTSAAMKLLVEETESSALVSELVGSAPTLVASWLLHTELHCAAGRNAALIEQGAVAAVLDTVALIDFTRGDLLAAGTHVPLHSNAAIHLATALRVGADEIVTYDGELAAAATAAGLRILAPQ